MSHSLVYVTCGDMAEARNIAGVLVTEKLAACANLIDGMTSVYRWNGEIQEGQEVILIAKTTTDLVAELITRVEILHSYDLPCVIAMPISDGSQPFLNWLSSEIK